MAKYRKKPVVIEAVQWFKSGDHSQVSNAISTFHRATPFCMICDKHDNEHGWIDTLEGGYIVCPSDWIITGVKGEHYPVKNDIFKATYEESS